jgi:predicted methyltransferase
MGGRHPFGCHEARSPEGPRTVLSRRRHVLFCTLALTAACSRSAPPSKGDAPFAAPPKSSAPPASSSESPADPPGTYMGRTLAKPMSYLGADWLDRKDREATQMPEHVLDVLGVHEGQTVADVGCGSGYFTVRLARRVGARGRVYATDLQPEMLALLKSKTDAARISNVVPIVATEDDAKLPKRSLDLVLLVDVYHELPKPALTLAQIRESLADGGRLALVEYRAEDPKVAIKAEHKMTLAQLRKELTANGWQFLGSDESLPEQRIVTFRP